MNTEQLDRSLSIAANAAYVLVVCSLLLIMFPGLRKPMGRLGSRIVWDWRYGMWLGRRRRPASSTTPTPAWVVDMLKAEASE